MSFEQAMSSVTQAPLGALQQYDERRAALLLHALAPRDQTWLLNALPASQQARLTELLQELAHLGITPDSELVNEAICSSTHDLSEPQALLNRLSNVQTEAVINVLVDEPNAIIVMVLCIADWSWKPMLLSRLGTARSQMVLRQLSEKSPGSMSKGVRQAFLRTLSEVATGASSANDVPSSSFRSMVRNFFVGFISARRRSL